MQAPNKVLDLNHLVALREAHHAGTALVGLSWVRSHSFLYLCYIFIISLLYDPGYTLV